MPPSARPGAGTPYYSHRKLHLFGASGVGVTTLGQALGTALRVPYFDTDAYYWELTDLPFTVRRPARDAALAHDLAPAAQWLLGNSARHWAAHWIRQADLIVFLWLSPALRQREQARYGEAIGRDPTRAAQAQVFLEQFRSRCTVARTFSPRVK